MKPEFQVTVRKFSKILEIEGARSTEDYAALLEAMDYGDQSDLTGDDVRDMCIASLQDKDPDEAAYIVLKHDMGTVLRDGQARNIATEMLDEKLWEEYADTALHERMFNVGSLLYAAFPQSFPKPDAVRVEMDVTAANEAARALLTSSPNEPFLVRLLADGMESRAILHRFYGKELAQPPFPNAAEVVWIVRTEATGENSMRLEIISSSYWLDALEDTEAYTSSAFDD